MGHVVFDKEKAIVAGQVSDVADAAGAKVVHGDDLMALAQEAVAKMRTNKACSTSDQDAHNNSSPKGTGVFLIDCVAFV
jgi:hypothetical protein